LNETQHVYSSVVLCTYWYSNDLDTNTTTKQGGTDGWGM